MTLPSARQSPSRFGSLVGGTLLGVLLAAAGVLAAYLNVATPLMSTLVAVEPFGGGRGNIGLGALSFGMIAGGALVVAGTSHLASVVAMLRNVSGGGPAARALASNGEVVVTNGVVPTDGPPIPELVIGAFGAAVILEVAPSKPARRDRGTPALEDAVGRAMCDAERVSRWLAAADLDFVVRVYAAVVVSDRPLERTPTCAVIRPEQLPAWIASLPRQRMLNSGRRGRLLSAARKTAAG